MFGKTVLFYVISVSLVFAPMSPALMAQEVNDAQMSPVPAGSVQYELYSEKMDLTTSLTKDIRAKLNRSTFDIDALLDSLNHDASEIIEFTKTAIAYEQYPGVLRGPQGTLFSRAGNSIDQALLLAKLLRDAGYDARIAGAELDTETAETVLKTMQQPVQPTPQFGNSDAILAVLEKSNLFRSPFTEQQREVYAEYVNTPPIAQDSAVYPLVVDTSDFIHDQLDQAGAVIGDSNLETLLVDEARQYYWVQFKDQAASPWVDVHPAFIDDESFSTPEASIYMTESVPENLQHRLRFQVFIERKTGSKLETVPITAPWERPVANLVGVPLTFSNIPNAMMDPASIGQDLSDLLDSSRFFAPSFGNSTAEGGQFFDLRGTLIDPFVANNQAADFFATIGDAFSSAIGGIGGQGAIPTLTAQWLEFTLISPGGEEQVFRRTTFDRIGADARRQNIVPTDLDPTTMKDTRTLVQLHTFMIGTGTVPRGYVIDSGFSRFENTRDGVDDLMSRHHGLKPQSGPLSDIPGGWADYLQLFSIFDMAGTIGPFHKNYRSGPGLVIHSVGMGQGESRIETIDIVSNPRRAIDIRSSTPSMDAKYVIQAGIWETAMEGALISGGKPFNTWQAFASAENAGVKPIVLLPGQSKSQVQLAPDIHAAIDIDLANGYAVIIPQIEDSLENAGWWRVNLATGETVGQLRDGRGMTALEFLELLGVAITFFALGLSTYNCTHAGYTNLVMGCCVLGNTLMSLLTFAIGDIQGLSPVYGYAMDYEAYQLPIGAWCEEGLTPIPAGPPTYHPPPLSNQPSISAPPC